MNNKKYDRPLKDTLKEFEVELGLPTGFTYSLIEQDDWSFIIKSHALLESCVSYLLTGVFKEPDLNDVFSRLDMSDSRSGKLAFAKAVGVLDKESRSFIRKLSEIRNFVVHSIKNVNFEFDTYVNGLDPNQKRSLGMALGYFEPSDDFEYDDKIYNKVDWTVANPKKATWFSLVNLVSVVYLNSDIYHMNKNLEQFKKSAI